MKKIIILFLVILSGCDARKNMGENGFKFFDKQTQEMYIKALNAEGVIFSLNADGTVLYSPVDEDKAQKIRLSILKSSFVPSVHYENEIYEKRFMEHLKYEGVVFGIELKEGKKWITWSESDNKKVQEIRKKLREVSS